METDSINEDIKPNSERSEGEKQERYGFVVFTGRHKILDYHKADGQQMATADDEESARTIVRALNANHQHTKIVEALKTSADWFHDTHRNVFGPEFKTCNHGQCEASRAALNPKG